MYIYLLEVFEREHAFNTWYKTQVGRFLLFYLSVLRTLYRLPVAPAPPRRLSTLVGSRPMAEPLEHPPRRAPRPPTTPQPGGTSSFPPPPPSCKTLSSTPPPSPRNKRRRFSRARPWTLHPQTDCAHDGLLLHPSSLHLQIHPSPPGPLSTPGSRSPSNPARPPRLPLAPRPLLVP